ncbi:MAG: protease inhibitor I42 family protein [Alphaproteobacteria bacterium]|nr:protease inhibitor I42 family protein [Alphaproteobacteria bacterium]MBM3623910.1 protease inhibitor I42 family protein [Alphaproteobacteria bacterium]MBM3640065.1 protease inhibitor I42 family protein [Alphaproteobacteria bacterium]
MKALSSRLLAISFFIALPAQAGDVITLAPGRSANFSLQENLTTGYSWRIDQSASRNLGILSISDGGRGGGRRRMVGSPSVRHWKIRALAPGHAEIVFAYQRPWEPAPVQTRTVEVEVAP